MWKRVIAPTVAVSIIWIAGSSVTTYHMNTLYESQTRAISENVSTIESAWAMRRDVWKLQAAVLEAKGALPQIGSAGTQDLIDTFHRNLSEAKRTSFTAEEKALVVSIGSKFKSYEERIRMDVSPIATDPSRAFALHSNELMAMAGEITTACGELIELNQRMIDTESRSNAATHRAVSMLRVAFLVFGPLVGLLLGITTARRLNRSISQISVTLDAASGKLGYQLGSVAFSDTDQLPALKRQVERISDRIRSVVDELEEARQLATQSERLAALGELAAGVAHEIRNPLTSVKLLIQTASERHPQAAMNPRQIEVVLHEIARMESMVQGLLDFAKPPQIRRAVQDLRQTVWRALNVVHARAEQRRIQIIERSPNVPTLVNADSEQLHTVFANLAINAIDAMPNGGELQVFIGISGDRVVVKLHDSGPGVSPELLERIFDPFVTTKARGTGLGLAISRRVMIEHQGRLAVENHAGGGACFTVEIPRNLPAANADTAEIPRPFMVERWTSITSPESAAEMS